MSLLPLADQIVRLSQAGSSTPVLVLPTYLSLRDRFLQELADAVSRSSDRGLQVEWLRAGSGGIFQLLGDYRVRWQVRRMNRRLQRRGPSHAAEPAPILASIHVTASIGRPTRNPGPIVLGLAGERDELPLWAAPIRIGGYAVSPADLQLVG